MRVLFLRCAVGLVVLSFAGVLPAVAQVVAFEPPPIDIPEPRRKSLLPQDVKQIQNRLTYIVQALRNAKPTDGEMAVVARAAITGTFKKYPENMYRYEVARHSAVILTPTLALDGAVRQVNVAMALAEMSYGTIQPALETMVAHPNAAVRYLGWQGYEAARPMIQLQGAKSVAVMFKSLEARAEKETSPRVLGVIWDMLAMKGTTASPVADKDRLRALKIMTASWRKRCKQVYAGNVEMSESVRHGVRAAVEHVSAAKKKGARRDAAQMAVDVAYCAAKALGKAFNAGEMTGPSGMAAETLLWEGEQALNNMLGLRNLSGKRFIREVLTNPRLRNILPAAIIRHVNPRTKRKYGVLAWVDFLKSKGLAVETPTEQMFRPPPKASATTKPAKGSATTKPAKGSATTKPAKGSPKTTPPAPAKGKAAP